MLLEAGTRGLVHLAGPTRLSRYDFGRLLANFVQGREGVEAKLAACRRKDVPMSAPRPADVSLDISRARALGFRPLTPGEGLDAALKLLVD
jgi:dTDP-4-dehydrorhamnose reductase